MGHLWHKKGTILEAEIVDGHLEKISADINLKAFYNDIINFFDSFDFTDMMGQPSKMKKGKFFNYQHKKGEPMDNKAYMNRTGNIFEKHFLWSKKPDGTVEFELKMEAKKKLPHSAYGWVEVKIDIVNRRIENKEILVGNDKKVVQGGGWEHRHKIIYKNSIIEDYLNKIPYVKDHEKLKDYYIEYIYSKHLVADIEFCRNKINKKFYDKLIFKHFSHRDTSTL